MLKAVLRPGDWVHFDGGEYQVVGLAGTSVRLRSQDAGADQVVLAGLLMASPGFAVVDGRPAPAVEPFGLLDALPEVVLAAAKQWELHIVEVETGLPPQALADATPRPEFDPAQHSLTERQRAKGVELGVSYRTVENRRLRYAAQGLWGLVDQRAVRTWEIAGRADARLVEVIREIIAAQTDTSTGTRSRLIRRVVKRVEEIHGPGVVPLPGRSAFYELVDRLAVGKHTFGSAVTRRQMANRPTGVFTPTFASRPGEQVQIDSTPIDVMVILDDGLPVRADLTIAVDVATRTICAAVLRPVGTKAVDAALLLAKMLVPEPMRPGLGERVAPIGVADAMVPARRCRHPDARGRGPARPVIVPDQIVIDHGRVFVSETFERACDAFHAWAQEFVTTHRLDDAALTWLLETDTRTSGTKGPFFRAVRDAFHLDQDADDLWHQYRQRMPELVACRSQDLEALRRLRAADWRIGIVTNGMTDNQHGKIHRAGLHTVVNSWCISDEVGIRKPEPAIFDIIAQRCGTSLAQGGWIGCIGSVTRTVFLAFG